MEEERRGFEPEPSNLASGPRGRHFLYHAAAAGDPSGELHRAMFDLTARIHPDDGSLVVFSLPAPNAGSTSRLSAAFRSLSDKLSRLRHSRSNDTRARPVPLWKEGVEPDGTLMTPAGIANAIDGLSAMSTEDLVAALAESVTSAMYWQEPDMTDVILEGRTIVDALARFAERSGFANLDLEALSQGEERSVRWRHDDPDLDGEGDPIPAEQILDSWHRNKLAEVKEAARTRPDDPTANWSGSWNSTPPYRLTNSNRLLPDGTPAALTYVEDGPISDRATTHTVDGDAATYLIDSDEDWVRLCDQYPMVVTAAVRHDWYRVTGRDGVWIIPDWHAVSKDWGAVRLTVHGYLTSATKAIPVRGGASMIAGWNPGETYWLTDVIERDGVDWVSTGESWKPIE